MSILALKTATLCLFTVYSSYLVLVEVIRYAAHKNFMRRILHYSWNNAYSAHSKLLITAQ